MYTEQQRIKIATYSGQVTALQLAQLQYGDVKELDPARWASFGELVPFAGDDSGEAAIQALAAYVITYYEPVSGEQLYNKAAELGIHRSAAGWVSLVVEDRLPYDLFALVVRNVYLTLQLAGSVEELASPGIKPFEADAFEPESGLNDKVEGMEGQVAGADDEPPADDHSASEPPAGDQPADEPPASEPPAGDQPADEPPASEPPAGDQPADEPPASEPPASEPPADEPPADEPSVDNQAGSTVKSKRVRPVL